ncbi:hypothetical protein B0H13DRAFT_1977729, partial [Mycena leptocephala]
IQLLAFITASVAIVSSATVAALEAARGAPGNLSARASGTLTLYTGNRFTRQLSTFVVNTGTYYVEPYVSSLFSAKASAGLTCLMFKAAACDNNCGVFPAVHGFRCQTAGSRKCATATNCQFH